MKQPRLPFREYDAPPEGVPVVWVDTPLPAKHPHGASRVIVGAFRDSAGDIALCVEKGEATMTLSAHYVLSALADGSWVWADDDE